MKALILSNEEQKILQRSLRKSVTIIAEGHMIYELKNGEYVRYGLLYGWTGEDCNSCEGTGISEDFETKEEITCPDCAGTGEFHGIMANQPENLGPDRGFENE